MPELPPNVKVERREDHGARKTIESLTFGLNDLRKHLDEQVKFLVLEIKHLAESKISAFALIASVLTVSLALIGGSVALVNSNRAMVDEKLKTTESKIALLDQALQQFKGETGAEVKGIYRFLLEKQRPDIIRRDVEEQKRETAPPPTPINPLAPGGAR